MQNITDEERAIVAQALEIMGRQLRGSDNLLTSPALVRDYLRLELGGEKNEHFGAIFLDTRHRVLTYKRLFHGTINSASVYPRVIVQEALSCNAAAMIITHNHPGGCTYPSDSDRAITVRLKNALSLVDVQVLDHVVVSATESFSFAERGLL